MDDLIIWVVIGFGWVGSLVFAYSRGEKATANWIFHNIAWGQYRDSGNGIVNDHGNCLDHGPEDCPHD